MMFSTARSFRRRLADDRLGSVLTEFALLAPVMLTLIVGVVQVGIHVQNANAVRSLAADGARAAVVEYQRGNIMTDEQIAADIHSRGVGPRYNLRLEPQDVVVTEKTPSQIAGTTEMTIKITHRVPNFLAFVDMSALDIEYERPLFLMSPPAPPSGT